MKTVYTNGMLAHIWAQQTQPHGRTANGAFYFNGKSIYSYGSHFCIARFHDPKTVLLTTRSYSVTTAKHVGYVRNALNGLDLKIILVPRPDDELKINLLQMIEEIRDLHNQAQTKRDGTKVKDALIYEASRTASHAERIKTMLGTDGLVYTIPTLDEQVIASHEQVLREREQASRERKEQAYKEKVAQWLKGKNVSLMGYSGDTLLRHINGGETVQTSRGASVPTKHAEVLYKAWRNGKVIVGTHIGDFTVLRSSEDEVVIGCHTLKAHVLHDFFK